MVPGWGMAYDCRHPIAKISRQVAAGSRAAHFSFNIVLIVLRLGLSE